MKRTIKLNKIISELKPAVKATLYWRNKQIWQGNYWELYNKKREWIKIVEKNEENY